jgi:hypothetical protein
MFRRQPSSHVATSGCAAQRRPAAPLFQRNLSQVFGRIQHVDPIDAAHHRPRNLDLHLIGNAALGIGPIAGGDEAAARRGGDHRPRDIGRREAGQARLLAIDVDLDRGIIERLAKLNVAKGRYLGQFGRDLIGIFPADGQVRTADRNLDGRRAAETHHFVDDVGRLKAESRARDGGGQLLAQRLFELFDVDARVVRQIDIQDRFFRAARPLIDGVDRKVRVDHPDVAERQFDVFRSDLLSDKLEGLFGGLFALGDVRAVGGPHAQAKRPRIYHGKNLAADARTDDNDEQAAQGEVGGDENPAECDESVEEGFVA